MHIHTDRIWEHRLIVEDILCPVHERIDVLRCRQFRRTLVLLPIFPEVFISEDKVNTGYPVFHHSHLGPADIIGHYKASMNGSDVERRSDAAYLLRRAEFGNCAVEHIQVVEKVNGLERLADRSRPTAEKQTMHREPLIEIFPFRQLHRHAQISRALRYRLSRLSRIVSICHVPTLPRHTFAVDIASCPQEHPCAV